MRHLGAADAALAVGDVDPEAPSCVITLLVYFLASMASRFLLVGSHPSAFPRLWCPQVELSHILTHCFPLLLCPQYLSNQSQRFPPSLVSCPLCRQV